MIKRRLLTYGALTLAGAGTLASLVTRDDQKRYLALQRDPELREIVQIDRDIEKIERELDRSLTIQDVYDSKTKKEWGAKIAERNGLQSRRQEILETSSTIAEKYLEMNDLQLPAEINVYGLLGICGAVVLGISRLIIENSTYRSNQ